MGIDIVRHHFLKHASFQWLLDINASRGSLTLASIDVQLLTSNRLARPHVLGISYKPCQNRSLYSDIDAMGYEIKVHEALPSKLA